MEDLNRPFRWRSAKLAVERRWRRQIIIELRRRGWKLEALATLFDADKDAVWSIARNAP